MIPLKKQQSQKQNNFSQPHPRYNQFGSNQNQSYSCGNWRKNSQWKLLEIVKYALFIEFKWKQMDGKSHASLWKLYQQMEKYIKTRNYRQCKLYHQRMLLKYGNIQQILEQLIRSSPEFEEILIQERENFRSQQIQTNNCQNNVVDSNKVGFSLKFNSNAPQTIQKNSANQKNFDQKQLLKYQQQAFAAKAAKFKNFILPKFQG